jgi:glycosyltransferase involved in cell wall biosynthesis
MIVDQRSDGLDGGGPRPEISVVLCTHNGERTIASALSSLGHQSLSSARYEVIVVNDGSADRTAEIARSHGVRVIDLQPNRGLAAARNAGTAAARAPIVAFTDDDCQPARDWLERLFRALSDPRIDGVSGRVVPACTNSFMLRYLSARNPLTPLGVDLLASSGRAHRFRLYLRRVVGRSADLDPGASLYSLLGANMALRRELILELGGFDEEIRFGGEEEELCRRAHDEPQGALLLYEPSAVVVHRFNGRLRDPLRRARAYGRGHPHAARKHRDLQLIVYPFPIATAVALCVAIANGRKRQILLAALAPLAAYARWPVQAWRTRSPKPLVYPYLELAEEASTMVGEVEGLCARS